MKGLSKSRYTAFCQCPKNLWLKVYKPEMAVVDEALQARLASRACCQPSSPMIRNWTTIILMTVAKMEVMQ